VLFLGVPKQHSTDSERLDYSFHHRRIGVTERGELRSHRERRQDPKEKTLTFETVLITRMGMLLIGARRVPKIS